MRRRLPLQRGQPDLTCVSNPRIGESTVATRQARPEVETDEVIEEENEVTRPSDLGFGPREIEVEPIQPVSEPDDSGFVQIRMYRTIDEFTYGNPHVFYKLEEGKVYRVPTYIASYLQQLGAVSNIA
jgi:hypothetical protein